MVGDRCDPISTSFTGDSPFFTGCHLQSAHIPLIRLNISFFSPVLLIILGPDEVVFHSPGFTGSSVRLKAGDGILVTGHGDERIETTAGCRIARYYSVPVSRLEYHNLGVG